MNMNKKYVFLVLSTALWALIALASTPVSPLMEKDIIGHWVGYEAAYPYFYNLNFDKDNTGTLVTLYPSGEPDIYNVKWMLTNSDLQILPLHSKSGAEVISCSVQRVDSRRIDIVISGVTNNWKRTALLFNQSKLDKDIRTSKQYDRTANWSERFDRCCRICKIPAINVLSRCSRRGIL